MTRDPREVLTRPAPAPDLTLTYGDHPDHVIDLRLPATPTQEGPVVVFLHGGFWRAAYDRQHAGPLAVDLAERGYPVAVVEYRRIGQPGGGWPGTFDDVARALVMLPGLVAPHADPAGFVLMGHSAGGQLALINGRQASGVVALAPVADLTKGYEMGIGDGAVGELLGGGPDLVPDRYDRVDPARRGPPGVPTVIVHGADDDRVPVAISRGYAGDGNAHCRLFVLPGADHFGVIDPLSSAWPSVVTALTLVVDGWPKRR
jgi:acetyl esterase/lipase